MGFPNLVSILIPVFNEETYLDAVLQRVLNAPMPEPLHRELVIVDDCSTDSSWSIIESWVERYPEHIRAFRQERNRGKGAAIRQALQEARGEFSLIQDADLEYNPADYPKLLTPLVDQRADAVFGSRFASSEERRVLFFWHSIANGFLTLLSNMVSDLNLTDMETGYKAFRTSLMQSIPLRSERFGIEPEMTVKLAQRHARIYEVPISYHGRSYLEGKKIGLKDAIQAVGQILWYALRRDIYLDPGARILDSLAHTPEFNAWMASKIAPYLGTHVLEIGAGIGNMTQLLCRGRRFYIASDIDQEHLERLGVRFSTHPRIEIHRCNAESPEDFAALQGKVNSVVCLNVLEHVENDIQGFQNIYDVLPSGGVAVILVPQDQRIYGTLDRVLGHHRRYSEELLASRMTAAGFQLERLFQFNRVTRPGWVVNGQWLKREHFSRFQLAVFDSMTWFWSSIDDSVPWGGVSVIAVGRKP